MAVTSNVEKLLETKRVRENRYITITNLEDESGVKRQIIYRWTSDKPFEHIHVPTAEKFMDYFECSWDELFTRTTDEA